MSEVAVTLASIADIADQKQKQQEYSTLLQQVLASGNVQDCQTLVDHGGLGYTLGAHQFQLDHVVGITTHTVVDEVPLVIGRGLLQQLSGNLAQLPMDSQIALAT